MPDDDLQLDELTEATSLDGTALCYRLLDPSGTPLDRFITDANAASEHWKLAPQNRVTFQARLSLTTGVDVTTSDVTGAGTGYLTPATNTPGIISLRNSSGIWEYFDLRIGGEVAVDFSTGTASRLHDIFTYNNSGTLAYNLVPWTNDTTRDTAIDVVDGIEIKDGSPTHRWHSTVYLNASKQCSDSLRLRYNWNVYNQAHRPIFFEDVTSHTYTTSTFRQWRATATNQAEIVCGRADQSISLSTGVLLSNSAGPVGAFQAIGRNSTSTASFFTRCDPQVASAAFAPPSKIYQDYPPLGKNYYSLLEWSGAAGTTTWFEGALRGDWYA